MKPLTKFSLALIGIALIVCTSISAAEVKKETCCEKAKAKGKECSHPCCVEARKAGKACESKNCNPAAEDQKKDAKKVEKK